MANTYPPTVRHISHCFIQPKFDVENAINPIHLTPSDLIRLSANYIQKGILFVKPSPSRSNNQQDSIISFLDKLRHSLSLVLVHFYPLAGQLETQVDEDQHTSLVFIDCKKGPGARLIHATLNMHVFEIMFPKHVPLVVKSLFDHDGAINHDGHTRPLLSIQVTELVDGVFIGCSMNHVCGDGTSYWNLFNTLSEIFMANNGDHNVVISKPPIHERWFLDGFDQRIKLPYTNKQDEFISRRPEALELRERIFHFSSDSVAKLKAKANEECGDTKITISSFQALSALIWRSITKARCVPDDAETTCRLAINYRGRLEPPLSSNLFGNAIQRVQGSCKAGELLSRNLGWAASLMHQAVAEHTNDKVRSEVKRLAESPNLVNQIGALVDPYLVHIGSSPRFDMYGNIFGMGKGLAILTGSANKFDGKVTAFPGRDGGGSIDLEVCLLPKHMISIESDEDFIGAINM